MKPLSLILAAASSIAVVATTPALAGHGGVSEREMVKKFVRIFDRLDRNNNGKLSRKGLRRLEYRDTGRRGGHNSPRVRVVFGDENFRIAFGTGGGRHGGGSSYIGPINSRTFHLYDLNRDGRIYRRELRHAVRDEFDRADRNGDGYLNQRELNRSRWYRNSHARTHVRYYPDYRHDARRKGHRAGHNDHRRDGHRSGRNDHRKDHHRADRNRNGHRDGHKADRHRNGHRDDHKADRRHDGRKDGHRSGHRDGRRDGHKADRTHDKHRDRDAHRARDTKHEGDRKAHHDNKKRKARDKRDRDHDDDRRRHDRDDA